MNTPRPLTPAQQRTLEMIRRSGPPVEFDPSLAADLRETMHEALAGFADRLGGDTMFINKHTLSSIHGCETNALLPSDFSWTPAAARGQVSHRAIQLLLNWRGEPTPREVVDDALARLADEEKDLGRWIAALGPGDESDLRGLAVERVTKFVEAFPPLDWRSHPQVESSAQFPIDGPILLRSKVDLSIGRPDGIESRKLIIDLKTGRVAHRHREDLRFYALIETLVRQVPPRRLATFYLDASEPIVEDVTEGVLRAALQRTLDGINRLIELRREQQTPARRPGPTCRWCSLAADCAEGQVYLRGDDEEIDLS